MTFEGGELVSVPGSIKQKNKSKSDMLHPAQMHISSTPNWCLLLYFYVCFCKRSETTTAAA